MTLLFLLSLIVCFIARLTIWKMFGARLEMMIALAVIVYVPIQYLSNIKDIQHPFFEII